MSDNSHWVYNMYKILWEKNPGILHVFENKPR